MLSRPPIVSIGLSVYNGERYLPETLDDLLGQSFGDFELIVTDNASTDATEEIVRAASAADPRIRYFRHARNMGALPNANFAFAQSGGRYYAVCAHDDRHAPGFLGRLVGALEAQPAATLAYGRKGLIDDHGRPFRFDPASGLHVSPGGRAVDYDAALDRPLGSDPVRRFRAILTSNDVNAPIYGLFRREVFAGSPHFQIHGVDRLLLAHAALRGPFAFVDDELFQFRIHEGSTLFLDRAARVARDTDGERASRLDAVRTLRAYLRVVRESPLPPARRRAAYRATVGGLALRRIAGNVFLPGADNYWGLRRWPWQSAPLVPPSPIPTPHP